MLKVILHLSRLFLGPIIPTPHSKSPCPLPFALPSHHLSTTKISCPCNDLTLRPDLDRREPNQSHADINSYIPSTCLGPYLDQISADNAIDGPRRPSTGPEQGFCAQSGPSDLDVEDESGNNNVLIQTISDDAPASPHRRVRVVCHDPETCVGQVVLGVSAYGRRGG